MTTQTEGAHAGSFILSEADGNYSRENVTIKSGEDLPAGIVIGQITATKKWVAYDPSASDGSQTVLGVLIGACDATAGDTLGAAIVRAAEVIGDELVYKDVSPAPVDATVDAALKVAGIISRRQVALVS